MPTNILSGDTADFSVRFHDALDNLVTPSSAYLTITYFVGGAATLVSVPLTLGSPFWVASWSTVGVDVPSDASWSANSNATTNPAAVGQLRIIDP